ncbi:MAG TPA: hypothetical protein PK264_22850, partial [Hyphomicrobiaceae bacterium]|nr:hypothetical protein [Hyphomicrobiaceae bacterium]
MSGSSDGTAKIWDAGTGLELRTLAVPKNTTSLDVVYAVAMSPDGRWVVSGRNDGKVKLWNAATGRELRTLEGH